jgi:putative autoinducer-2 (AI-2) aldolase
MKALTMAHNAIQQGAAVVDMGRNVFQADTPIAMLKAAEAMELYETVKNEK